jgi:hypothetical protein
MNDNAKDQQTDSNGRDRMSRGIGFGLPIGVALGVAYGIIFDNIGVGIALGAGAGLALGVAFAGQKSEPTKSQRIIILIALGAGLVTLAAAALLFLARFYLGAGG